jgi:hypothetical protein
LRVSFASMHESAPAIAIGILIVPLVDTLRVFTIRLLQGISPFRADRSHIHHRLLLLDLSHKTSSFIILGFNLLIIMLCLLLRHLGNIKLLLIILPTSVLMTSIPSLIIRYKERRLLYQLGLLGNRSWILPSTIVKSIVTHQFRVGKKHRAVRGYNLNYNRLNVLNKDQRSLKDIEPILLDTYLRFRNERDDLEHSKIEEVKS